MVLVGEFRADGPKTLPTCPLSLRVYTPGEGWGEGEQIALIDLSHPVPLSMGEGTYLQNAAVC